MTQTDPNVAPAAHQETPEQQGDRDASYFEKGFKAGEHASHGRLRYLAAEAAHERHMNRCAAAHHPQHPEPLHGHDDGEFDECSHPDCLLVRGAPARAAEWHPLDAIERAIDNWRTDPSKGGARAHRPSGSKVTLMELNRAYREIQEAWLNAADELEKLLPPGALAGDSNSKR